MPRLVWLFVLILLGFVLPPGQGSEGDLGTVKDFALSDAKGQKHTAAEWKGKKAVVLIFLGTDCPVSNSYAPEYRRLAETYAGKGAHFYGVHPDPDVTAEVAAKHAAEYHLSFAVLLDPAQRVAKQTGVTVVPEAVVLAPSGKLLYRGRINDLYTLDGTRREAPRTHDLEAALQAVLAGKPPPVAHTKAFGCPLPESVKPSNDRPNERR